MAIRNVILEGDPMLRKKSKPVREVTDHIRETLKDMVDTMHEKEGVGLAAPQVGVMRRMFVAEPVPDEIYYMINPEILEQDGSQVGEEGCLSVPDLEGVVERPQHIKIKALGIGTGTTKGVDADAADAVTEENLESMISFVKGYAASTGSVIAVTGAIDLVADSERCFVIRNGKPQMGKITGTGCQLSGMMTAFITANPDNVLEAAASAVCAMGLAGEIGYSHLAEYEGNSTYRNRIIDAISLMTGEQLDKGAKYEIR